MFWHVESLSRGEFGRGYSHHTPTRQKEPSAYSKQITLSDELSDLQRLDGRGATQTGEAPAPFTADSPQYAAAVGLAQVQSYDKSFKDLEGVFYLLE